MAHWLFDPEQRRAERFAGGDGNDTVPTSASGQAEQPQPERWPPKDGQPTLTMEKEKAVR